MYSLQESVKLVRDGTVDLVAGVVGLLEKEECVMDAKILPGHFMTVPQAIAFPLSRTAKIGSVVRLLNEFVKRNLKFVAEKIKERFICEGLFNIKASIRQFYIIT